MQWKMLIAFMGAALTLVSSVTLPYMVTNSTSEANVTAQTVPIAVVFYRITASNGTTCILLKVDGIIQVDFKHYIGEETLDTYMINDAVIEGNCEYEDTASIRITWEGYTMIWNFGKTPVSERWYVSEVELTVNTALERYHGIRAYVLPKKTFKLVHTQMLFPTPVGKSYTCSESIVDLTVPEGEDNPAYLSGKVFLRSFQLQPFMYKGSSFGPAFDCNERFSINDETAPITKEAVD